MAVDEARNLKRHSRLHQQSGKRFARGESQKITLVAKATVAVNRSLHRHGVGGGQTRSAVLKSSPTRYVGLARRPGSTLGWTGRVAR